MRVFLRENYRVGVVILAFITLTSCSGHRGPEGRDRGEMFEQRIMEQWDIDKDGVITCADATLKKKQRFARTDLNNDDMLNVDEFKQAPWSNPAFAVEHLYIYDENNDGLVSLDEFTDHPDDVFKTMDKNQDCVVSNKEIALMLSKGPGRGDRRGPPPDGGGRRPSGGGKGPPGGGGGRP